MPRSTLRPDQYRVVHEHLFRAIADVLGAAVTPAAGPAPEPNVAGEAPPDDGAGVAPPGR